MRCIFCPNDAEPSREHVFPSAIGGKWVINRVCKSCNDKLGHDVDKLLSEHFLTLSRLYTSSIGDKYVLLEKTFRQFKDSHLPERPDLNMQIIFDKSDGRLKPIIRYSRTEEEMEDGRRRVQIAMGSVPREEIKKILEREIARGANLENPDMGIDQYVDEIISRGGRLDSPSIRSNIKIDIDAYKRAIFKIVYESAWYFIGDDFLDTEFAERAKKYIMDGVDFPYVGDIRIDESEFGKTFGIDSSSHFVMYWRGNGVDVIAVGVFDIFSAVIEVGPCRGGARDFRVLINNVKTGSVRELDQIDIVRMMLGKGNPV